MNPVSLYGLFDAGGICLYVGRTSQPKRRFTMHKYTTFRDVDFSMRVFRLCRHSEAVRLETQIIKAYRRMGQALRNRYLHGAGAPNGRPDAVSDILDANTTTEWPDQKSLLRSAMSILGQQKSEAKTKAARQNAKKPRKSRRTLTSEQAKAMVAKRIQKQKVGKV